MFSYNLYNELCVLIFFKCRPMWWLSRLRHFLPRLMTWVVFPKFKVEGENWFLQFVLNTHTLNGTKKCIIWPFYICLQFNRIHSHSLSCSLPSLSEGKKTHKWEDLSHYLCHMILVCLGHFMNMPYWIHSVHLALAECTQSTTL